MHDEPLRLAFYGLAASELDLFTLVRRQKRASLVLVVDPGPMAIARRLAEIAGVQTSCNPWDLPQADLDWIVTGRLARTPAAPLQRAAEGGTKILDVAEATVRLGQLGDVEAAAEAETAAHARGAPAVPEPVERKRDIELEPRPKPEFEPKPETELEPRPEPEPEPKPDLEFEEDARGLPATRDDWAPPIVDLPADVQYVSRDVPAAAAGASEEASSLPSVEEPVRGGEGFSEPPRPPAQRAEQAPAPSLESSAPPRRPYMGSPIFRPMEEDAEVSRVVGWALDGMMSSVRSGWGVAIARTNGDVCLVQRGIELQSARPDLLEWLKREVEGEEGPGNEPPANSGALAWVPLKVDAVLVGAVVLGREAAGDSFSSSDRTWLHRIGERIASILSNSGKSGLTRTSVEEPVAPASVWASPVLERAIWARGWLREQFDAAGCWLFASAEGYSEPQLIDETWGSSPPPFLRTTIREAMERSEPQVWLEREEERALVIQPLAPWGIGWLAVIEGMPWHGDGKAALARLKKAAAMLARLLKNT